ncbi:MAG: hypothetical protein JW874_13020 [Spirochaetales bacterium]|nr:hypothetical protein [Spirochaetales bacterium]
MITEELMDEYGLELNDVRWYLCSQLSYKICEMVTAPDTITAYLWSGELEAQLYNIEERYLQSLQEEFDRSLKTETELREIFSEIYAKRDRKTGFM